MARNRDPPTASIPWWPCPDQKKRTHVVWPHDGVITAKSTNPTRANSSRTPFYAMNTARRGFRTLRTVPLRPAAASLLRTPFKPTPRPSLAPACTLSISGGSPVRAYSSDPNPRLSIDEYHRIADHALEYLVESFEELAEDFPEIDVDLAVCSDSPSLR